MSRKTEINEPLIVATSAPLRCNCTGGSHFHGKTIPNRALGSSQLMKCYSGLLKRCVRREKYIPVSDRGFLDAYTPQTAPGIVFTGSSLVTDSTLMMAPFNFHRQHVVPLEENFDLERTRGDVTVDIQADTDEAVARGLRSDMYERDAVGHIVSKPQKRTTGEMLDELMMTARLSHGNLVRFLGGVACEETHGGKITVKMVEVGLCNLDEFITESHWIAPKFAIVRQYTLCKMERDTLSALDYLHMHGVVHGDFRGAKVIVFPTADDFTFKVNLGESTSLGIAPALSRSPYHRAPETEFTGLVGREADMWAWALTMYRAHTCKDFFRKGDPSEPYRVLGPMDNDALDSRCTGRDGEPMKPEGFGTRLEKNATAVDGGFLGPMGKCLALYPQFRPTARELLVYPRYANLHRISGPDPAPPPAIGAAPAVRVVSNAVEFRSRWGVRPSQAMDPRLEARTSWGKNAVRAAGDFTPSFLYKEGGLGDTRPGNKRAITLSRDTLRSYVGTENRLTTEIHRSGGADVVLHRVVGRRPDISRANLEYAMKVSNGLPDVYITIDHYTVGVTNVHLYVGYITDDIVYASAIGLSCPIRADISKGFEKSTLRVDLMGILVTRGLAYMLHVIRHLKSASIYEAGPHTIGLVFINPSSRNKFGTVSCDSVKLELGDEPSQLITGSR
ncbi:ORF74 [Ictalurid herpesvirus 1]|nr:ORF74 [Ictalurid herpesvirus 1]